MRSSGGACVGQDGVVRANSKSLSSSVAVVALFICCGGLTGNCKYCCRGSGRMYTCGR